MITGVSLRGVDAALVLLRRSGGGYFPISLAFFGESDRSGAIDVDEEDTNARLVTAYFADRAVLRDQNGEPYGELDGIQGLVWCVERSSLWFLDNDLPLTAVLDGDPVFFALVARPVWDALAAGREAEDVVASEIYRGHEAELAQQFGQLAAVDAALPELGLRWAPGGEPDQRYPTDLGAQYGFGEFLPEARKDYAGVPVINAALDEYERLIRDWI